MDNLRNNDKYQVDLLNRIAASPRDVLNKSKRNIVQKQKLFICINIGNTEPQVFGEPLKLCQDKLILDRLYLQYNT